MEAGCIDPVLMDGALQMNVVWARHHWDLTLLPTSFDELRLSGPLGREAITQDDGPGLIRHELRARPSRPPISRTDHYFVDRRGQVLAVLTGMEGTGSKALTARPVGVQHERTERG